MRRLLFLRVLAAAVLTTGCGLGFKDDGPTTAVFLAQAEDRCTKATVNMRELGLQAVDAPAPNGDLQVLRNALRARRLGYLEVRGLDMPRGVRSAVTAFVDSAVEGIDQIVETTRAKERGDGVEEATARGRAAAALERARKQGTAVGFSACLP